jgi:hypothetical protein
MEVIMKGGRVVGRVGNVLVALLLLFVAWGETVGVGHAFKRHGAKDGWYALFVPPYAWWRGVEFFRHPRPANPPSSAGVPLDPADTSAMNEVFVRAKSGALRAEDIERFREIHRRYVQRGGTQTTAEDAGAALQAAAVAVAYEKELSRCLLASLDDGQPFESAKLLKLRSQLTRMGRARAGKFEADTRLLVSTAQRTPFTDELGRTNPPLGRDRIEAHMAMADTIEDNFRRLVMVLQEGPGPR